MNIEQLRQAHFSPHEIRETVRLRAKYESQQDETGILKEIGLRLMESAPHSIETYGVSISGVPSNLAQEEKWQLLEQESSLSPANSDLIDDNELQRLRWAFARANVLYKLGFVMDYKDDACSVLARWDKNKVGNVIFEVTQSREEKLIFLIRTMVPEGNGKNLVREDLVSASDINAAREYWGNKVKTEHSPVSQTG